MGLLKLVLALALALALLALCGLAPAWLAARGTPMIDVHGVPWRTHAGRLLERYPIGQGFRCDQDGLRRIEVALVSVRRPPRGGVRLRLVADHARGELVREVEVEPGDCPPPGRFVAFDFEPIEDSAGRSFYFELRPTGDAKPGDHSPIVRYHGQVGHDGAWGYQEYEGPVLEGRLRPSLPPGVELDPDDLSTPDDVPHPWLRAVSFAALGIAPRLGVAKLELWEEGREDGPPLRVASLPEEAETLNGHLFFTFDPIEESRWRRYTYRLTLPPHTVLLGDRWGPAMKTWHGLEGGDARLLGATLGGAARHDRDLVFRAYAAPDPRAALERAAARAGWRLRAGLALWIAAATLLLGLALARRKERGGAGFHTR